MSEQDLVLCTEADGVLQLSFNRPAQRNALNGEMYAELTRLVQQGNEDPGVRVILLQGANGYFTAGNDLADFVPVPSELLAARLFLAAATCFKPIVAAVEGGAIGIGTTLLGHCDFAYAGKSTRFAAPFTKLGVCAEGGSSLWLAQNAGHKRAAEILLLGEPFTAQAALEAGLINAVVEDGTAAEAAMATARRLASLSPEAVQTTKRLMKTPSLSALKDAVALEEKAFLGLLSGEAAQKAIAAFLAPKKR